MPQLWECAQGTSLATILFHFLVGGDSEMIPLPSLNRDFGIFFLAESLYPEIACRCSFYN